MAENEETRQLKLHDLKPPEGSERDRVRVGRGESGRRGKTAGRGTKGLKARGKLRPGFEGGQTPLARRLPKLPGFTNPNKQPFTIVNLEAIEQNFQAGETVSPDTLREKGLIRHRGKVKVLAEGDVTKALTVRTDAISKSAREKIESAGGTVELLGG